MQHLKKLALASAIGSLLLGAEAANAHVTYNSTGNCPGACPTDGSEGGPWTAGDPGYTGSLPANWVAMIHNAGGTANSQTASSAGAGFAIGMGGRAYYDSTGASGFHPNWGHTADFGLIELEHDATVTISVTSADAGLRPAFGLWSGWATGGSRHGSFPNNGAIDPMAANPLGSGLGLVDVNAWSLAPGQGVGETATLTRFLTAGNYTLILGGYDSVANSSLAYTATISAAAVPIPAAVWLFGSALAGMGVVGRRKTAAA